MKNIAFDTNLQQWDAFKHFHIPASYYNNPVIRFATGELGIAEAYRIKPHKRREYSQHQIAITSTADGDYKFLLPDGTKLPKSWLTHKGGQYLLVDLDSKRAVKLNGAYMRGADVPSYMQQTCGGFLREGGMPVGAPVNYAPPLLLTPERKDWLQEVSAVAGATLVLADQEVRKMSSFYPRLEIHVGDFRRNPREYVENARIRTNLQYLANRYWSLEPEIFAAPYLLIT